MRSYIVIQCNAALFPQQLLLQQWGRRTGCMTTDMRIRIHMKKTFITAIMILSIAALTGGCVPTEDTSKVEVNPDFQAKDNIEIDFVQLHNDAIEGMVSIEEGQPFVFIQDLDISGDASSKKLTIRATALNGSSEEDCSNFAAALLCQINDAAVSQDSSYELSSTDSFGTFYNDYSIDLAITDADNGSVIYMLETDAGEDIGISPDYMQYVEDWIKGLEIYQENLVYDINGNVVRDE